MVLGWRRAFCTSIPKDRDTTEKQQHQQCPANTGSNTTKSPRFGSKFGFFSNPSAPRLRTEPAVSSSSLRCRIATTPTSSLPSSPKLQCKTTPKTQQNNSKNNSPRLFHFSNPSSPKSPSSFSLLKTTLRLSKGRCGICLQNVKTGQGTAIFTAECSHSFHFPCIAAHVSKQKLLVCPVCSAAWKELPLLSLHQKKPDELADIKTKPLRVYNDDEPLKSPVSLAQFNPIPESEETENDDVQEEQEFQGFFVSNNSNSGLSPRINKEIGVYPRNVEVRLMPEAAVVASGRSYESCVVVLKVRAPPETAKRGGRRLPVDLVALLDVSASMGSARLQIMKRAMRLVISSLGETDRLSIVAFSSASKRLSPLRRMTSSGRRSARRIVDALTGSGGQAMSVNDALKKAAKVLEDRRERNPHASIMILSDGQDDASHAIVPNQNGLVVSSTRLFSNSDIPVHSIGLGACPHALEDDAFGKLVGGLLTVAVQDLRLQLGFASGSGPAEIASVYSLAARPECVGSDSARVGDMYPGEEREMLVELKVPASSGGSHRVMSVRSVYRDALTQEPVYSREQGLLIPRPLAVRSSLPSIARLKNLHVSTRAVAESRRLAERNDLAGAHHLLSSARALLMHSGSSSAEDFMRRLDAELVELSRRRQVQSQRQRGSDGTGSDEKPEQLTPTSAWRAAERLAKVAIMRKHMNRVSDLHGFENARF